MRFTRIIAGTITAGLVGLVPVSISSPASATDNLTTTTTATPSEPVVTYGDQINVTLEVVASDGTSVIDGSSTLYAMEAGSTTWVPIATPTYPGSDIYPVEPKMNTAYKVVYSGYAATTTFEDNYAASESAVFTVGVKRTAVFKTPGLYLVGKVKPDFGKKKVILKRKKGKKYVAWKKVRTNAKGQFRVKAPNQRGFKFSVIIPSDSKFIGFTDYYQVY
jgi:hypothetical protein